MTAINVLLEHSEVHVFADAGHYSGRKLAMIAPKLLAPPELNAVMGWSGPSRDFHRVAETIQACRAQDLPSLLRCLPRAIRTLGWLHPFSVIVAGVHVGVAMGVAVEEGGKVYTLSPGSVVKSLASDVVFDIGRISESGLRMMEDQRSRHGVVGGYAQYVNISAIGMVSAQLKIWPDIVACDDLSRTLAAKIQDLSVEDLNFKGNAVTGSVSRTGTGTFVVPNVGLFPVTLTCFCSYSYFGNGSANGARAYLVLTRGSTTIILNAGRRHGGSTGGAYDGPYTLYGAGVDEGAGSSETYTFSVGWADAGGPPGAYGIVFHSSSANGFYSKR